MRRMYSEEQVKKIIQNALSSGQMKDVKVFEEIVDKDGHARFIEGEMDTRAFSDGVEFSYAKWSLSGSHIMFVLAGKINNATSWSFTNVCDVDLPEWIYNKIVAYPSNYIDSKNFPVANVDYNTNQSLTVFFQKIPNLKKLRFYFASFTATADRYFRIAFDLLIDNE